MCSHANDMNHDNQTVQNGSFFLLLSLPKFGRLKFHFIFLNDILQNKQFDSNRRMSSYKLDESTNKWREKKRDKNHFRIYEMFCVTKSFARSNFFNEIVEDEKSEREKDIVRCFSSTKSRDKHYENTEKTQNCDFQSILLREDASRRCRVVIVWFYVENVDNLCRDRQFWPVEYLRRQKWNHKIRLFFLFSNKNISFCCVLSAIAWLILEWAISSLPLSRTRAKVTKKIVANKSIFVCYVNEQLTYSKL